MNRCVVALVALSFLTTGMAFAQTGGNVSANLIGVYGSGHFSALEANYSYTKNSQRYSDFFVGNFAEVQANVHEVTGAYVLRFSHGPINPFALAGGGMLVFDSTSANNLLLLAVNRQTRPTFLYGLV